MICHDQPRSLTHTLFLMSPWSQTSWVRILAEHFSPSVTLGILHSPPEICAFGKLAVSKGCLWVDWHTGKAPSTELATLVDVGRRCESWTLSCFHKNLLCKGWICRLPLLSYSFREGTAFLYVSEKEGFGFCLLLLSCFCWWLVTFRVIFACLS